MARKPSIANLKPKRKYTRRSPVEVLNTETDKSSEEVPHGVNLLSAQLVKISSALEKIADGAIPFDASVLDKVFAKVEADMKALDGRIVSLNQDVQTLLTNPPRLLSRVEALESIVERRATSVTGATQPTIITAVSQPQNGEVPKKRGRPSKAELEARAAANVTSPPVVAEPEKVRELAAVAVEVMKAGGTDSTTEGVSIKNNTLVDQGSPVAANGEPPEKLVEERVRAGAKPADLIREFRISFNRAQAYFEAWKPAPVVANPAPAAQQVVEVKKEYVAPSPCKGCGVNLNDPSPAHSAACEIAHPKAAPVASTTPSLDDVRAVAITYAGKHGKEKLAELLKKYGADKLSSVAEEQRAALMVALTVTLQNGA